MRKYIEAIIALFTISILFYTIIDLREQVKQVDVLQFKLDSVIVKADIQHDLNFANQVENARYRMFIEYLKEENPEAADEFENFISRARKE
jgi:hypothetical protein